MKRNTVVLLGVVVIALLAAALIATLKTVLGEGGESTLHVHILSSRIDTNGSQTVSFTVTNGSSKTFPWLATTAPNGQAPYYVIETRTGEGWSRTIPFTNYWFSRHFLADTSWEFDVSLATSERPRRMVFFYTIGQPDGPWLVRQAHDLLKNLTLEKDTHELRTPIL